MPGSWEGKLGAGSMGSLRALSLTPEPGNSEKNSWEGKRLSPWSRTIRCRHYYQSWGEKSKIARLGSGEGR